MSTYAITAPDKARIIEFSWYELKDGCANSAVTSETQTIGEIAGILPNAYTFYLEWAIK